MEYVKVLLPSICVGLLFWYVIRSVVRADSIERREMDRFYSENEDSAGESPESTGDPNDLRSSGADPTHDALNASDSPAHDSTVPVESTSRKDPEHGS
ncbi:hypothetical protein [Brevibacterium sp. CS2]|uniref:Uncharacterized protein n=1 Tax=Brevibacterium pityocampae TaxID=506594 RepID=A0ABP8J6G6_9MICO|nr:hypothetical protein [Brevibacterium sp. CS2]QCP04050.1 hypothetical protein FDF13_00940 [Brevibacterium sp. CS2]